MLFKKVDTVKKLHMYNTQLFVLHYSTRLLFMYTLVLLQQFQSYGVKSNQYKIMIEDCVT